MKKSLKLGYRKENSSFDDLDQIIKFSEDRTVKFLVLANARMLILAVRGRNDILMQLERL